MSRADNSASPGIVEEIEDVMREVQEIFSSLHTVGWRTRKTTKEKTRATSALEATRLEDRIRSLASEMLATPHRNQRWTIGHHQMYWSKAMIAASSVAEFAALSRDEFASGHFIHANARRILVKRYLRAVRDIRKIEAKLTL